MNVHQRQTRKIMSAREVAEAVFAKRAAPKAGSAPRILEDVPKPVVVETKRSRGVAARAVAVAKPIDHAVVAAVSATGGGDDAPPNAFPSPALAFLHAGDVRLSPEQAMFLTTNCVHPVQQSIRPLDHQSAQEHIATLVAMMQTPDAWMEETQIRFGVLYGRIWVMDGNHRLRGQSMSGCKILWNVKIDQYDDEESFLQAFHKFNTNSRGRSEAQILGAIGYAAKHGITKQTGKAVYSSMPFIISRFRAGREREQGEVLLARVVDSRLRLMEKYADEARMFDACLKGGDSKLKKKLLGAGVTLNRAEFTGDRLV
ncbi:hypothetical protein [Shinella zoogloeoides]|uniref:hypothetical protein n=1 Tax=Shinella zoogloeoides TaxID=352475 RepID=UPI001F59A666|nr:hypothetical protein [Shinella zoogloeoides]